jgi:hypothetical protein
MLETAVDNTSQQFGLEQEITETSRVDTYVGTLLVLLVFGVSIGGFGFLGCALLLDGLLIFFLVVNKIISVVGSRHVY